MSKPRKGDRVRVTFEGVFGALSSQDNHFVTIPDGRAYYPPDGATFEVLEPAWESGDIVKDARGVEYKRGHGGWLQWASTNSVDDTHLTRPLTLLVRGGKPVTS